MWPPILRGWIIIMPISQDEHFSDNNLQGNVKANLEFTNLCMWKTNLQIVYDADESIFMQGNARFMAHVTLSRADLEFANCANRRREREICNRSRREKYYSLAQNIHLLPNSAQLWPWMKYACPKKTRYNIARTEMSWMWRFLHKKLSVADMHICHLLWATVNYRPRLTFVGAICAQMGS